MNPSNRSPAVENRFRLQFERIPTATYFLQETIIPEILFDKGAAMHTPRKQISFPADTLTFMEYPMTFAVDEDYLNWFEIYSWMRAIGNPATPDERGEYERKLKEPTKPSSKVGLSPISTLMSQATLHLLNSDNIPIMEVKFHDMWPRILSQMKYTTMNEKIMYVKATATFDYTTFEVNQLQNP